MCVCVHRFRENFKDTPWVKVPKVLWEYTSAEVLTLEYVPGQCEMCVCVCVWFESAEMLALTYVARDSHAQVPRRRSNSSRR